MSADVRRPDADPGFEARFADWFEMTVDGSVGWLTEVDAHPVGMLHMFVHARMPTPARDTAGWAYVGVLFVESEYRNAGLGRRLLDKAFEYATDHGLSRILLHPTEKAVPLYRRAGFRVAGQYLAWSATNPS